LKRYRLALITKVHDKVRGSKLFTEIDFKTRYNLIRIHPSEEWKTSFYTTYICYWYLVISFRIVNGLASIQKLINVNFKDMIDLSIVTYIDDILIYSQIKEELEKLIKEVVSHLQKCNLAASIDKYKFQILRLKVWNI
jgi:hypothetical protein